MNGKCDLVLLQKGQKTDVVSVLARLEFGERIIGESAKVECTAEHETEVNYLVSLPVSSDDPVIIDEIASKPLLCMLSLSLCLLFDKFPYFKLNSIYLCMH